MLRSYVQVRRVSFFLPSFRLNEFNRRQIQNNPTVELLEQNYNELQTSIKASETNKSVNPNQILKYKKISKYDFSKNLIPENETLLSYSLNQADIPLFKYENIDQQYPYDIANNTERFIAVVKHLINIPDSKHLYDILKLNCSKISSLRNQLSSNDISVIIKRVKIYNSNLNKNLRFLTKNKSVLNKSSKYYAQHIKKCNEISRTTYVSTRSIFNQLCTHMNLKTSDYENIISYYYQMNKFEKCIDVISQFETKSMNSNSLHLTNKIWAIKLELLSYTTVLFWRLFGNPIYRVSTSKNLNSNYTYPHHTHNFQILMQRYENDKLKYKLPDDLTIVSVLIKGLGKHCDINALNKLIESYWGIKINIDNEFNKVEFLKHFNINKNVPSLLWPNEDILISILLAYAKNGYVSLAIEINNLIIEKYYTSNNNNSRFVKYWETALLSTGLFGEAVEIQLAASLKNVIDKDLDDQKIDESIMNLRYKLFDDVYKMAERSVGSKNITREMINLKIKYSTSDALMNQLPIVYRQTRHIDNNRTRSNYAANINTLYNYVKQCCIELASRGKFLDANTLIDNFVTSETQIKKLKEMLAEMQEIYARERVRRDEEKRRIVDDDNDFELW